MVNPNWGLMQSGNALNYVNYGMQLGKDARAAQDQREVKNALSAYVTNPDDPNAFNQIAKVDPRAAMAIQSKRAEQQQAQQKAAREKAMTMAQLFNGIGDEATYQQRLNIARRMGIDTTGAPANFDPAWVEENGAIMRFAAEKPEALSTFGKIAADEGFQPGTAEYNGRVKELVIADSRKTLPVAPGGGVAVYDPITQQTKFVIQPNPGTGAAGQPASGPQPGTVVGGYRFKGGNPNDRGNWEPAGGPTQPASGDFRPVGNAVGVMQQVFPNARVTSGYRGPNHPLSIKNPDSFHARTRAAVDIAPIPGMTFEQAKARFEAQGYYVHPDSRDEVKNPSKNATGPHWHFVIGARN